MTSWHCLALSGSVCGFSALPLVVCVCVCERVVHARSDKSQVHLGFQKKEDTCLKKQKEIQIYTKGPFLPNLYPAAIQKGLRGLQGGPKELLGVPRDPWAAQRSPKEAPKGPKGEPKEPQRSPKGPNGSPKEPQRRPKWTQNVAKMAPWGHLGDPNGDKKLLRLQNDTKMKPKTDPKVALLSTSLASYFE